MIDPGVIVTERAEVQFPIPELRPPYYNLRGELLTTYGEIRQRQQQIVIDHVDRELKRTWTSRAATPTNVEAMRQEGIKALMFHQATGNLHPSSKPWEWLDIDKMDRQVRWKREAFETEHGWHWLPRPQGCQDRSGHWRVKPNGAHIDPDTWEVKWVPYDGDDKLVWNGTVWVPNLRFRAQQCLLEKLEPKLLNHRGERVRAARVSFADARENELKALQLLRRMVPEQFRRYLKHGFVTAQGPSGLTYQIQRQSHIVTVWDKGMQVARLCVYVQETVPPTDDVVAKLLIAEMDEPELWAKANVTWRVKLAESKAAYQERIAA
jgi:hypothetical protein